MKLIIVLVCVHFSIAVYGQNAASSNLVWKSASVFDVSKGNLLDEKSTIVTFQQDHIEWRDERGAEKKRYTIQEVRGSWNNVQVAGQITYQIVAGTERGTLTIQKNSAGTIIRIMMIKNQVPEIVELRVESVNQLPQ